MPPKATWKGNLKISLISFPVRIYSAISSTNKISFHQLHKGCGKRINYKKSCPTHGELDKSEIARGYEFEKGRYIILEESDFDKVKLETTKTIEIRQFIPADTLNCIYTDSAYYVAPDGPVAEEAFRVIREAMRDTHKTGVGQVAMRDREYLLALQVYQKGFLLTTLHYADEVRNAAPYFEDIEDAPVPEDQLQLAEHLVENKSGTFDPSQFKDKYNDALLAVIKAKISGEEPPVVQEQEAREVGGLMDALKQSISETEAERGKTKPPARSVKKKKTAKKKA
ncbi:MAG: Ku protein [Phycisphaerae bacterium]|nr:Ku protein [Phycisphaerae bacterium]